jgi:hypothetical protein
MQPSETATSRVVEQFGIPTDVARAINVLTKMLTGAAGTNLAGLIRYGGVARGRYRPGKSDVNVAVLFGVRRTLRRRFV